MNGLSGTCEVARGCTPAKHQVEELSLRRLLGHPLIKRSFRAFWDSRLPQSPPNSACGTRCTTQNGMPHRKMQRTREAQGRAGSFVSKMVPPAGFEPAISTLKGWRPRPLDDGDSKAEYNREIQLGKAAQKRAVTRRPLNLAGGRRMSSPTRTPSARAS